MAKKKIEDCMKELESVVSELESGDESLDKSLELFEKGIKLSKQCQLMLDEAEKKVTVLIADTNGGMKEEDFLDDEGK